jgi:hypothetical protein
MLLCALQGAATAAEEPRTWFQLNATGASWRMDFTPGSSFIDKPNSSFNDDTLGLPRRKAIPGIGFGRLIGERWRIEIDYGSARRRGSAVLASNLQLEGDTFLAGTRIESDVELGALRVKGGWAFYKDPQAEAGVLIGGQWIRLKQRLSGTAVFDTFPPPNFNPVPSAPRPRSQASTDAAPVFLVGAWGSWKPADAWRLNARAELGDVRELALGAQWWLNRNLGLGAGYRTVRGKPDVQFCFISCGGQLQLDYRIHGPTLSVDVAF